MTPASEALPKILSSPRINMDIRRWGGNFMKTECPFHQGNTPNTFWLSLTSGKWGCWSARCAFHTEGVGDGWEFREFLEEYGFDDAVIGATVADIQWEESEVWQPAFIIGEVGDQNDIDGLPNIRWPHIYMWQVDWQLLKLVYDAVMAVPDWFMYIDKPVSEWSLCPAAPGSLEHDHWLDLQWLITDRKLSPAILDKARTGYCKQEKKLVYPLINSKRQIFGVAKRIAAAGEKTHLTGTPYVPGDDGFERVETYPGMCLYGESFLDAVPAQDFIAVVEGQNDTLMLMTHGYPAAGKFGNRLSREQAVILKELGRRIILVPDADAAGVNYTIQDISELHKVGAEVEVADYNLYGGFGDPGEFDAKTTRRVMANPISTGRFLASANNWIATFS